MNNEFYLPTELLRLAELIKKYPDESPMDIINKSSKNQDEVLDKMESLNRQVRLYKFRDVEHFFEAAKIHDYIADPEIKSAKFRYRVFLTALVIISFVIGFTTHLLIHHID